MQIVIRRLDTVVDVDFDSFPQNVKDFIIHCGLTTGLNLSIEAIANGGGDYVNVARFIRSITDDAFVECLLRKTHD